MPFLGKRSQGLCQETHAIGKDGQLAGPRPHRLPPHANDVPDIERTNDGKRLLTRVLPFGVDLDRTAVVLDVKEHRLPEVSKPHDSPTDTHGRRGAQGILAGVIVLGVKFPRFGIGSKIVGIDVSLYGTQCREVTAPNSGLFPSRVFHKLLAEMPVL
jgi:hypothetical protein